MVLAVVVAGCGGAAPPQDSAARGVPAALAHDWESRASAIARAAAAGNSCEAQQLAVSLRNDVRASRSKVPRRLRSALLTGVESLADRTTCTPIVTEQTPPRKPRPPKEPKPPEHHEPPGHHKHGDGNQQ
jgi:hypothetical protein